MLPLATRPAGIYFVAGRRAPRSLSLSRINARRGTRLIRFAGPTTACRANVSTFVDRSFVRNLLKPLFLGKLSRD